MSADSFDNFEYEKASEHTSQAARRHYWAVAIGLQDVDGLSVSPYLREVSSEYVAGNATLSETGRLIRRHRNAAAHVLPDDSFLVAFYENALGIRRSTLSREDMVCTSLFENPRARQEHRPRASVAPKARSVTTPQDANQPLSLEERGWFSRGRLTT
ncbi:hypothetical protein [uncultured Senegalimassilia sp.]|uniref:hypothetical protein n=1 Tax=uncultured Senegalimassilia sp. TaxID=1714350 RepID=UPI0026DEB56D|nr:hypothetical protein [uncultured Senegalimassilia sp.]